MIIYFSGTGNSRYIASGMAEKLDDKLVDAGVYIKNRKKGKFYSDKPWIFVAPTYCWRLPRIFEKFIRKSVFFRFRDSIFCDDLRGRDRECR